MTELLAVSHLSKHFPVRRPLLDRLRGYSIRSVQAVENVSLTVARGETLGIVGNLDAANPRWHVVWSVSTNLIGVSIRFNGNDVLSLRGAQRRAYNRQVQMIFQDPFGSLNPRMTVGACLAEALAVHNVVPKFEIARRVRELPSNSCIWPADATSRRPHEFSGGQRQRIGIARALAVEPSSDCRGRTGLGA